MNKILIVDDSTTARMVIKRCLKIIGLTDATVIEVAHGQEALDIIKEQQVDLLVTDLNMPVMSGETLISRIKANPKLNEMPVIVVTCAGNPAKEAQLLGLGVNQVVNKPVSAELMLTALEGICPELLITM